MADLGLLCVHPHPDDESIACGGVLARYVEEGLRVMVVTCTGGEEGENLAGINLAGRPLPDVRADELAEALVELGVEHHANLGYRDSGMADTAGNVHPESFARADLEQAAARLAGIIRGFRPEVVVSDDAGGSYGHPDHIKAHRVTVRAVELARAQAPPGSDTWRVRKRYARTMSHSRLLRSHRAILARGLNSPFGDELTGDGPPPFGTPDHQVTTSVDVRPWLQRKRRAMAAHRSQIGPESFFLTVPEDLEADLFGTEEFVLEEGRLTSEDSREDDLFAGLRPARARELG